MAFGPALAIGTFLAIFLTGMQRIRNEKLQKILGYGKSKTFEGTELRKIQSATLKYYQLTQFKRTMFKCTDVVHDQKSGRINKISFQAVVENGMLKQD